MAEAVRRSFDRGGHLLVEAGTGVGKSLAYLVPAALDALRNGRRVIISTNTIALQEQLREKDIPLLRQALVEAGIVDDQEGLRVAVLKGRGNYLCYARWVANYVSGSRDPDVARLSASMLLWLEQTSTGDRSELRLVPEEWAAWSRLSAADADCLSRQHRHVREGNCFLLRARKNAEAAHLIIVNHALLLADI
ncbi:MAG: exonuclease, partial [Chloroflexota bacterium]